jgi:two-component system, NarL family, invasion response regulator UvrY
MIRVLIADDHPIIRQGLKKILADEPEIEVEAEASDGHEAMEVLRNSPIDVAVLDISMPRMSGIEVIKQLTGEGTAARILVLSVHSMKQYAVRVLRMGAAGYLTKDTAEEELIHAVKTVAAGKRYISPDLAAELADFVGNESWDSPLDRLSDREYTVFKSIAAGKSMKEIAFELNISIQTVSTYRARLLRKLNVETNAGLVRYAVDWGILE